MQTSSLQGIPPPLQVMLCCVTHQGLVAVSYGTAANYSERNEGVGMPPVHHILVWNLAEALRWASVFNCWVLAMGRTSGLQGLARSRLIQLMAWPVHVSA